MTDHQPTPGAMVRPAGQALPPKAVAPGPYDYASPSTSGMSGTRPRQSNPATLPFATARPLGSWFDGVADRLAQCLAEAGLPAAIERVVVDRGELTLFVDRSALVTIVRTLRDDPELRFEMCLGASGVHYPYDTGRELHVVYPLLSITHNRRIRVETTCPIDDPHVPSVVSVYPGNNWHEREAWDFFGVIFDGHPALTRIEMPDDWPGHPQRKDYPLGGIPVEYKGGTIPAPDQRRRYQ